ncbi:MAG: rubredoxin [Bacillota bacterium]|nr:rubredoxin [Bacillota bacterium]
MAKYVCSVCGFVYDEKEGYEDGGIAPGTLWENVPADFECPVCGVAKELFEKE